MQMKTSLMYLFAYVVVCFFSVAVNQYYGYFGYMPLDQSVIFNGAWRIMGGQVPYVDFWAPFGIVPMLMQAAIFRSFGVTWTNYVLHASLLNACFAACILFAGTRLGLKLSVATMYGIIAALVTYPPMGTPFTDNHAAIMSSLLLLVVVLGIMEPDNRWMWWLLCPPLSILSFLSKQTPSVFVIPVCGVAMIVIVWRQRCIRNLAYAILSAVICLLITVFVFHYFDISWDMFRLQAIDAARATAEERFKLTEANGNLLLAALILTKKLTAESVFIVIFILSSLLVFIAPVGAVRVRKFEVTVLSAFSAATFFIFLVFAGVTDNQPATGLALLVVVFLFSYGASIRAFLDQRIFYVLGTLSVVITASIQYGWTSSRHLNDFDNATLAQYSDAAAISPQLAHMHWTVASNGERDPDHYRQLVIELRKRSRPTVFFSDVGILDALLDQKPVAPALFWAKRLSYPADGRARTLFDNQFKRNIIEANSDLVVVDGSATWMGTQYTEFSWLAECLRLDQSYVIGKFSLIPLDIACVRSTL